MEADHSSSLDLNSNVKSGPSECQSPTGENVSMAQIANARDTFSDLESAYRNFRLELDGVKEEHKHEVGWSPV